MTVQHGNTWLDEMQIVVVMFVPMHVFEAPVVAVKVRVPMKRVGVTLLTRFFPSGVRNPQTKRDQRDRRDGRNEMRVTYGERSASQPHDCSEEQGGCHVAQAGHGGSPSDARSRPALLPRQHNDGGPVIRHDRMQHADRCDGENERGTGVVECGHDTKLRLWLATLLGRR